MRLGWPALPFKCDLCGAAYIRKNELEVHIRKQHRSSPKPPVGESDGEHNLEVGKTSKDEENTDIGTIYASPKALIEEIDDKHDEEGAKAPVKLEFVNESVITPNMGELKMSIISELSNDKYDEDVNEFQSRYDHRVIRDLSNNSGDEDDASTKGLETNNEEEGDGSVKNRFVSELVS